MIPPHYKLQYSEAAIAREVVRIGSEISFWAQKVYEKTDQDLLVVPVLRGGIFFFADLIRKVRWSVEVAPGRTRAYEQGQNAVQNAQVQINIDGVDVKGRSLLLVDDICDSGRTLKVLSEYLMGEGAIEVRSAVLIKRALKTCQFQPDWTGFEYESDEWFVGYGMEDSNRWSNLPSIYIIEQEKVRVASS